MERHVGEKFNYYGVTLMVETAKGDCDTDCIGCHFLSNTRCIVDDLGDCSCRKDGEIVIFTEVIQPTYPMYRIATKKRKYSTTPIVHVTLDANGKEQEDIVICVTLPKKDGDVLSNIIVQLLNQNKC